MTPPAEPIEARNRAQRRTVDEAGWLRQAADLAARAHRPARPVERRRRRAHGCRCAGRGRAARSREPPLSRPAVSLGRAPASPGAAARTGDFRSLRPRAAGEPGPAALARSRPLGAAPSLLRPGAGSMRTDDAYAFLPAEGAPLHQIPVGPVHAGIIEPGHFRFSANGEIVVRLEERLGYVHKGTAQLMVECADRAGGAARRPRLGRQHGRLCARLRARRRDGDGTQRSAPRRPAARADGRTRADRQSSRRHRRDLQRRVLRADPRALRHPARARAAGGPCRVRASPDDGPHRARRRRRRSFGARARRCCAPMIARSRPALCADRRCLRHDRLAAGPHRAAPASCVPSWRAPMPAAASSAARRGAASTRAASRPMRPTTSSTSRFRSAPKATSTRACGCASTKSRQSIALVGQILDACRDGPRPERGRGAPTEAAKGWRWSRASAATFSPGSGSHADGTIEALPPARSVLVPVAAARSGDRGQHRRRFPALQQILQLLLFRARPLRRTQCMNNLFFEGLLRRPADRAAPAARRRRARRAGGAARSRARTASSAAASRSARSMPAPATAASSRSTRSTMPSTISSASACASSPRRAMPTCCW